MNKTKRVIELDVLRGIAVILVMGSHFPIYPIWGSVGRFGVDLFFVLSGFLISNLLFTEFRKSGTIRLSRFFFRRALKLYPSFYLLVGCLAVFCSVTERYLRVQDWMGELLLVQNYLGSVWPHTWSLAVEEHFYIFLPIILAVMMKYRKSSTTPTDPFQLIPYVFVTIAVLCLAFRTFTAFAQPTFSHLSLYAPSHLRFDSLFYGVFLSYLHNFKPTILQILMSTPWRFPISVASILGLVPVLFFSWDDPIVYTIGFTTLYLSFGTMLMLTLYKENDQTRKTPGLAMRSVAKVGVYSYTIYLWNIPTAQFFSQFFETHSMNPYLLHALYFATSILIGVLLSKVVELPVLKLRDRIWPTTVTSSLKTVYSVKEELTLSESENVFTTGCEGTG